MHEKESAPIEPIDFTSPQEQGKNQTAQQEIKQHTNHKIWLSLVLLILCCLAVFIFLPEYVAKKQANQSITDSTNNNVVNKVIIEEIDSKDKTTQQKLNKPENEALSAEQLDELKLQAEELLLQIIEKQESLQSQAVTKWAEAKFKHSLDLGTEGDEHFRKQHYQQAILTYQKTINVLNELVNLISPMLIKNLEQGESALAQAEKSTAVFHFEMALAIDKNNKQAAIGLQRSETIKELFKLLKRGGNIEAANRLEDAQQIYQQAIDLDGHSTEAKIAYDRVFMRLNEQKFNQLINTAYNHLKSKQYGNAKDYFFTSRKIKTKSQKAKTRITRCSTGNQTR